jgi:hypothetical protein
MRPWGARAADFRRSKEPDQPAVWRGAAAIPPRSRLVTVRAVPEIEGGPHLHQPDRVRHSLAHDHRAVSPLARLASGAIRARDAAGAPLGRVAKLPRVAQALRQRAAIWASEAEVSSASNPGRWSALALVSAFARGRASAGSRCPQAQDATLCAADPTTPRRAARPLRARDRQA